jgi:NAD(P)-dependent dehydrogenase (short-subunit alcohol dehydrogenase family)
MRPPRSYRPQPSSLLFAVGAAWAAYTAGRALARRRRRIDFANRVVLITGGSRGLGLVLARQFAQEGAQIAICARDEAELSHARADLESLGTEVVAVACDVTHRLEVDAMLAHVRQRLGPIDVLVNNAGMIQTGPMEEMTVEDYDYALRVHFWGPFFTTLGVLPDMRRRGFGRVVNIASLGGKIGIAHLLPYSTSKFALVGFSEGLRGALARDGIHVTTVCPGLMRTGSPRNALFKGQHRREYAWFSIGDSLPLLSAADTRAARLIVNACRHGDAELIFPASTALLVKLDALFPSIAADLLALSEQVLPGPGGIGREARRGAESESAWSPSWLTTLSDRAAARNNEMAG